MITRGKIGMVISVAIDISVAGVGEYLRLPSVYEADGPDVPADEDNSCRNYLT